MNTTESSYEQFLESYLPSTTDRCFVTVTYAQSLDARIACAPGERTKLSGADTKRMTHFLRSKHDAILVGIDTVIADNPRLNCRYPTMAEDYNSPLSPQPVFLDTHFRWDFTKDWALLRSSTSKKPLIITESKNSGKIASYIEFGGEVLQVQDIRNWTEIARGLYSLGYTSVMVEGGAKVIDSCLTSGIADSVIITIAPVFLGTNGLAAAPSHAITFSEPRWWRSEGVPDTICAMKCDPISMK